MFQQSNSIKTTPYIATAIDVNIAVENDTNIQTYFLDQSNYVWAAGQGFNGTGIPTSGSSPLAVIATRPYIKLITGGLGALDASGYAWTWGHNQYGNLGNNTSYPYNVPQSVVGGKRWLTLQAAEVNPGMVYVGLDYSSYAWAWGVGTNGILGNNNTINASSPVSVVGGKQWLQIAVSSQVVLGLDNSSYAWAWGNNSNGAVGDNTTTNRSSPTSVLYTGYYANQKLLNSIYANNGSCYAINSDYSYVYAWGNNTLGNLGDGTTINRSSPVSVQFASSWAKIYPFNSLGSTAGAGVVGVGSIGTTKSIYMWGPIAPSLTGKSVSSFSIPTALNFPTFANMQTIQNLVSASTSTNSDVAILDGNFNVWVWGNNNNAQLGTNSCDNTSSAFVKPLVPATNIPTYSPLIFTNVTVVDNSTTNFALDQSSYLWGWGFNLNAALGYWNGGALTFAGSPVSVNNIQFQKAYVSYGLDVSSYLWFWGNNYWGIFGNNATNAGNTPIPRLAGAGKQYIKVIADNNSCWGIDLSSYLWSWGTNSNGQLGDNTSTNRSSPISVLGLGQVIDLACCSNTLGILDRSSYAWVWGQNNYGQLGNNTTNDASSPTSVIGNRQFINIIGGCNNFIAADSSSYLWSWGNNTNGNLGDNTTSHRSSPVSIVGNKQYNLKNVFSGPAANTNIGIHVVLDYSSYAWAFGYNTTGKLGVGDIGTHYSPTSVIGGYQFAHIEANSNGILGLTSVPTSVYIATGSNAILFTGTNLSSSPIAINPMIGYPNYNYTKYSPPNTFTKITGGSINNGSMYVLDSSSYAWGWGYTTSGALGLGTPSNAISSSPLSVMSTPLRNIGITQGLGSKTYDLMYALDISSYAWVWGNNYNATFGNGSAASNTIYSSPISVPISKPWIKFVSDGNTCWAIDASSYLWSWGLNSSGQCGINNNSNWGTLPQSVVGGRQVIDVAAGSLTCSMLDSSSYAWFFGIATTLYASSPISILGGRQFTNLISAGGSSGFIAADRSSYLWGWGSNLNGCLGNNTMNITSSAVSVIGGRQFILKNVYINSDSNGAVVALDASSYAWVWGYNAAGQLGINTTTNMSSPVSVVGGYRFAYIEMGYNGLIGVNSFPNSIYYITGINAYERSRYTDSTLTYSSPTAVIFGQQYLQPNLNILNRRNILGK